MCLAKRARRSSGPVRTRALAWLIVRVRSPAALRLATISARMASTAPSRPFERRGPAGLGGPGSADRVQRVGLALPAAVLPVRTVHLDDPDAGRGDVAGQPGAVTTGPLDPPTRQTVPNPASHSSNRA